MALKLDIGCGGRGSMFNDFIGIDIHPEPKSPRSKAKYLKLDFIKDDLPFEENSVDFAIALHIIEHLDRNDGVVLIERALGLLKPSAQLIVSCPDLELLCRKYIDGDFDFFNKKHNKSGKLLWPGYTIADRLNWAIHEEGHKWAYDTESLIVLAEEAGARQIRVLPKDHPYCFRSDHETGIIITK